MKSRGVGRDILRVCCGESKNGFWILKRISRSFGQIEIRIFDPLNIGFEIQRIQIQINGVPVVFPVEIYPLSFLVAGHLP